MKKLFIAATLSLALLPVAYAQTYVSAEVVEAQPSPLDAFVDKFEVQAVKEGVSINDLWDSADAILFIEHKYEFRKMCASLGIEGLSEEEEKILDDKWIALYAKALENRSPKEIVAYAKEISSSVVDGVYDFSSSSMFIASIAVQSLKTGVPYEDIEDSIDLIVSDKYRDLLDSIIDEEKRDEALITLSEKLIAGKTPAELVAYAKKISRYDFSSKEAFGQSFSAQCKLDGVSVRDAGTAGHTIISILYPNELAYTKEIEDSVEKVDAERILFQKAIANRSPKELIATAEKLSKKNSTSRELPWAKPTSWEAGLPNTK